MNMFSLMPREPSSRKPSHKQGSIDYSKTLTKELVGTPYSEKSTDDTTKQ
jgi:hypothetical protein